MCFWMPPEIPVEEIVETGEPGLTCARCQTQLLDSAYPDGSGKYYCEECIEIKVSELQAAAEEFAMKACKITEPLPKYYPRYENRCTPEEYDMGARESYSPNAYRCHCRHNCTNYEKLIKGLSRDPIDLEDQIFYLAIRDRITELVEEAIDDLGEEDFDDAPFDDEMSQDD